MFIYSFLGYHYISGKTQFDEESTVALQLVGPGENIDKAEQYIRDKLEWLKVLHL